MPRLRSRLAAVETAVARMPTVETAGPSLTVVELPGPVMVTCASCGVTFDESDGAVTAGGQTFHATPACATPNRHGPFTATAADAPAYCVCGNKIVPGERFVIRGAGAVHHDRCPPPPDTA